LLWAIYLVTAGFTVWTQSESVWLFLGAGVLVWLVRAPPKRWFDKNAASALMAFGPHGAPTCAVATGLDWTLLAQIGVFFAKAGAFVFGSGLAIVPSCGGVVRQSMADRAAVVDAVAVAMISGRSSLPLASLVISLRVFPGCGRRLATFLPCYLRSCQRRTSRDEAAALVALSMAPAAAIGLRARYCSRPAIYHGSDDRPDRARDCGLIWKVKKLPEPGRSQSRQSSASWLSGYIRGCVRQGS
jgi:hypothetical protein